MTELLNPDRDLLQTWLDAARVEQYLCGECEGLHLGSLQGLEGVVNSRVFLQQTGILLSTEIEVRPMAVLPLSADLGRLNMDYPTLKLFLDVVDDASPLLVAAANFPTGAGVASEQFADFISTSMEATRQLADECFRLDYLYTEPGGVAQGGSRSVH
jgi:hypothetical protein